MTISTQSRGVAALEFQSAGEAKLPAGAAGQTPEELGTILMHVIRAHAVDATGGDAVELVSLTLDVTGAAKPDAATHLSANIDRKTRTIIFTGGRAEAAGETILTATAVFRILTGA